MGGAGKDPSRLHGLAKMFQTILNKHITMPIPGKKYDCYGICCCIIFNNLNTDMNVV